MTIPPPPPDVPEPPADLDPLIETWPAGKTLHRNYSDRFKVNGFNRGPRPKTRFAFFGDPPVPVLYAGETEETAVAETLLHDIARAGGRLTPKQYADRLSGALNPTRDLQLAMLHSGGLRRLGLEQTGLTDTDPYYYDHAVRWAQALHENTALDGLVWMSRQWNSQRSVMLFGDRVDPTELEPIATASRNFALPDDFEWLAQLCHQVKIEIIPPW